MSGTGAAIRAFQLQKGGAVANKETIDAQLAAKFGPQASAIAKPSSSLIPPPEPVGPPSASETFTLEEQEVTVPNVRVSRGKGKSKGVDSAPTKTQPTVLVEYEVELAGGTPLSVPEYAHMARHDGEVLIIGFPISQRSRLKPARGSTVKIKLKQGNFSCFATGIHTDVPEWGVSISVFLVLP